MAVEYYDITEPDIYEECEARCLLYAYGVPHDEGGASGKQIFRAVTRAKIIPAGSED